MTRCFWFLFVGLLGLSSASADTLPNVRVGVLKFGTVSWELSVIRHHQLDREADFSMQVVEFASGNAAAVALQAGRVDIIVNDWLWVLEQNRRQKSYRYFPYSTAVGGLVVSPESGIQSIADLKGKRVGVAGGPVDKSWLLIAQYAKKSADTDLRTEADVRFAAPPLLNRMLLNGQLDAVVNYWHYNARLVGQGMSALLPTATAMSELGIGSETPMLGWVFDAQWLGAKSGLVDRFIKASYRAKHILATEAGEWQRIRPLMQADNDAVFKALIDAYRAGIPENGRAGRESVALLHQLLTELSTGFTYSVNNNKDNLGTAWWQGSKES